MQVSLQMLSLICNAIPSLALKISAFLYWTAWKVICGFTFCLRQWWCCTEQTITLFILFVQDMMTPWFILNPQPINSSNGINTPLLFYIDHPLKFKTFGFLNHEDPCGRSLTIVQQTLGYLALIYPEPWNWLKWLFY